MPRYPARPGIGRPAVPGPGHREHGRRRQDPGWPRGDSNPRPAAGPRLRDAALLPGGGTGADLSVTPLTP